ncbi:type II toxin-antitoxin system RelE/ParE family toxin [Stutzerimonas nitrititolerans]|uniref:type II toxin-antitoxin system RelE/ParE family toxin n=1 Tax=Stutzerimonas nitrititolerans TaxID=2482751 RepID=UPI0028B1D99C|nr:type II toxin-antitoxin system RelE/ParE family toxin [Stutzerimonas nitrititolerans]
MKLAVRFFQTSSGNEPVRDWLREQSLEIRRQVGTDIKTVQFGWPLGMPVVRKLTDQIWEVRTTFSDGIARVLFTTLDGEMILLHGFIKKSQVTPKSDIEVAKKRNSKLRGNS